VIFITVFAGPTFALMQRLVPDEMRARTLAIVLLLANLVGMGLGPLIVGMISDALRPSVGNDSLRYAMLAISCVAFWMAYQLMCVRRTVSDDLAGLAARSGAAMRQVETF
jgi:MFS family permease